MTRSKGTMGTEFTTGNVLQIFLVLVAVFLVTGLIISASGGIQGLLEKLCETIPQLCGEGGTSSENYMTSKQSTEDLYKAANVVMTGERKYPDIVYTELSVTGAVPAPIEGEGTGAFETMEFTTAIDEMTACENRCEERTPKCYCVSCEIIRTGEVVWMPNPSTPGGLPKIPVREKTAECKVIDQESGVNKSAVLCDLRAGYPELQYDARKGPDVYYTFDSSDWKWKCPDENYESYMELSMMPTILTVVDEVHTEIGKELIAIDSSFSDEEKYNSGLDVLRDLILSDSFGKDDYITIHYTDEETEKVTRKDLESLGGSRSNYLRDMASLERNKYARCVVKNFHLPQDVTKAEEWIAGNGDPEFLVYWQKFPDGEDKSWTSFSTWLSNVFTVVLWGIPAAEILGAGKRLVVGGAKKVASKLASKSSGLVKKLAQKISGKTVEEVGENAAFFVLKEGADRQLARLAYETYGAEEVAKEILKRSGTTGLSEVEQAMVRRGLDEISSEAYESGIKIIGENFEKIPDAGKASILNKFMSAKGIPSPTWSDYKRIMKIAGVTTGLTLLGAFFDSLNAKYEEHPQSILLKSPYKDPEPYTLERERPMVLYKSMFTGKVGLTRNYVPFYLASPCHADLELSKKEIVCENYIHDLADESTICTAPGTDSLFDTLFEGETERCEYFPTNVDVEDFAVNFLEKEVELKEKGMEKTLLFGREVVNGEEMDVIYDPIHDMDYYFNRTTQQIEYVKYTADVCIGDFHLDEATGRLVCSITEGEERKMEKVEDLPASVECWVHPKDSNVDDPLRARGYEIEDENGIMGFAYKYEKVFACRISSTSLLSSGTSVILYGNLTEEDKLDFFFSVVAEKSASLGGGYGAAEIPTTFIILKDENRDNILDVLGHNLFKKKVDLRTGGDVEWMPEASRTLTKEMETGTNCKTDSVLVTVNRDPYKDDEHNFCFTKPAETTITLIFVGALVADVIASVTTSGAWTIVAHTVIGVAGGTAEAIARNVVLWPG